MKKIAVFCGSSEGNDKHIISTATQLGLTFAKKDITLVYQLKLMSNILMHYVY